MSSKAIKRRWKDIKNLIKNNTDDFMFHETEIIGELLAVVIGPENTPYEGGFYLFKVKLPESYPIAPPKVTYHTQGYNIRFNPNLYRYGHDSSVGGKVCLSILNTWHIGPPWKPAWNLRTVFLAIQSVVLVDEPLKNEPGYETAPAARLRNYRDIVLHENYRTAVWGMLSKPPEEFEVFLPQMRDYFIKNFDKYCKKLREYEYKYHDFTISSTVYSGASMRDYRPDYQRLLRRYCLLMSELTDTPYEELEEKYIFPFTPPETESTESTESTEITDLELAKKKPWLTHPKLGMDKTISQLKKIAELYNISSKKTSEKTGKIINKAKSALLTEIREKIEYLVSLPITEPISAEVF